MTSYLTRLSPVPAFSPYTGPHKVGTIDVELPVSELESPSPSPDDSIPTIQYRIFYPCEPNAKGKNVKWLPAPQRGYVSAYTRFLGAGSWLADLISYALRSVPRGWGLKAD
jgi:platelet-activating factor acetylhydrolase